MIFDKQFTEYVNIDFLVDENGRDEDITVVDGGIYALKLKKTSGLSTIGPSKFSSLYIFCRMFCPVTSVTMSAMSDIFTNVYC